MYTFMLYISIYIYMYIYIYNLCYTYKMYMGMHEVLLASFQTRDNKQRDIYIIISKEEMHIEKIFAFKTMLK